MDKLVVARLTDGRLYKGHTDDFQPGAESFTINVTEGPWKGEAVTVKLTSLKALFFVKSLQGNRAYRENKLRQPERQPGKKVTITFHDGETIRGTTTGASLGLDGFYLFPADHQSNNKRIYVVRSAIRSIRIEK